MQSFTTDVTVTNTQVYERDVHTRLHEIPHVKEECSNTDTINSLLKRIAELEKVCTEQQYTIAMQGDKIHVLAQIFKARQKKTDSATYNGEVCGFATYPLPGIGEPEE